MYGVDVAKYQPFYNSNNPEYERGQFGERYIFKDLTMNLIDFNIKL